MPENEEREWLQPGFRPKPGMIVSASRERPVVGMLTGPYETNPMRWYVFHFESSKRGFNGAHLSDMRDATPEEVEEFLSKIPTPSHG